MVLPDRIELSTSPLPMECSTTELRQHARYSRESAQKAPTGGRFLPQGPLWRKRAATEGTAQKRAKIRAGRRVRADPVPGLPDRRPKRRDERESCLEFDHFGLIALQGIDGFWPGFARKTAIAQACEAKHNMFA